MSLPGDEFNLNTKYSKGVLNPEGVGLFPGEAEVTYPSPPIPTYTVSVKEASVMTSDVEKSYAGPLAGTSGGSGGLSHPNDNWGYVTPTGNKIQINGAAGSESIELVHHTGAAIIIDADGAIFVVPSGKKGFGLNATQGDGVIAAQNRIVIKGNSGITLETEGNLELNVGQHLFMDVGGDFNLQVSGATTFQSDGTITFEAVKDLQETIGGIRRTTVAGDIRTQVVGTSRLDAGKKVEIRSDDDVSINSQKTIELASIDNSYFSVNSGKLYMYSKDDISVNSDATAYLISKNDVSINAQASLSMRSAGNMILSSQGNYFLDASAEIDMRSPYIIQQSTLQTIATGTLNLSSSGTIDLNAGGAINIQGSTTDIQTKSPSVVTVLAVETTDPRNMVSVISPQKAEFPDANTILDSITSEREAPDFPENANKLNADEMSRYENEGDTPNPKAKARAQGNQGAGSPSKSAGGGGAIPESGSNASYDGSNNGSKASDNPYPLPASTQNSNDRLSRLVTVGMMPGLSRCPVQQMGLSREQILKNSAHLAANIIDPILERFGSRIRITDHLRIGTGGSRHYLGKAVDMASAARNFAETAEAAAWVRDNLPFDRLFLEANSAGTIHMHIEAAPPGQTGARTVWSCQDPKCQGRKDGLDLAYAQQGLKKMGFA